MESEFQECFDLEVIKTIYTKVFKRGGHSKNLLQTGSERVRNRKDVIRTQCSLLGRGMNVLDAYYGRGENAKDVART